MSDQARTIVKNGQPRPNGQPRSREGEAREGRPPLFRIRLSAGRELVLKNCRLYWRITAAVFLSILFIEALILIPSYRNYEADRLGAAFAAADAALTASLVQAARPAETGPSGKQGAAPREAAADILGVANISGLVFLDGKAEPLHRLGQPLPGPEGAALEGAVVQDGRARAAQLRRIEARGTYRLWVTVETPHLAGELFSFLLRIAALVAIVSIVVTVSTMLVLRWAVLKRLIELENAVCAASRDLPHAERYQVALAEEGPERRKDELGALVGGVNALLRSVSQSIAQIEHREQRLASLNASLENRVWERTAELEAAQKEAVAASNAKSAFLANMSHELRTPLNAIIGFSEVISDELLGPIQQPRYVEYARDILGSGQHLLSIINDVLDLSRIEANRAKLDLGTFDLNCVVREITRLLYIKAQERGVSLSKLLPERPTVLYADERLIKQTLLNLAANAINFTEEGGDVVIAVAPGPDHVHIEVRDSGIGIDKKDLENVIKPFRQVAHVEFRSHQGTGLGLPLSKRFVELHGGTFKITSELHVGTVVSMCLPRAAVQPEEGDMRREQGEEENAGNAQRETVPQGGDEAGAAALSRPAAIG